MSTGPLPPYRHRADYRCGFAIQGWCRSWYVMSSMRRCSASSSARSGAGGGVAYRA